MRGEMPREEDEEEEEEEEERRPDFLFVLDGGQIFFSFWLLEMRDDAHARAF